MYKEIGEADGSKREQTVWETDRETGREGLYLSSVKAECIAWKINEAAF